MSNDQQQSAKQSVNNNGNFEFPTFTARGFIGEIRKTGTGDDSKLFVSIAVPFGNKDNRKYQYYSAYVAKPLYPLFDAAFQSQTKDADNHVVHSLSVQIASVVIESPFFEINTGGYLQSSGILKCVSFDYASNN